jgi:hypothetical protein
MPFIRVLQQTHPARRGAFYFADLSPGIECCILYSNKLRKQIKRAYSPTINSPQSALVITEQ